MMLDETVHSDMDQNMYLDWARFMPRYTLALMVIIPPQAVVLQRDVS